jgi:hypothetical protein
MHSVDHLSILRKAGVVLVIVGVLDIGLMIYSIMSRIAYASSLNVFAVAAGIFLLRGNLRAASLVRWFALFFASTFVAMLVVWPAIQPLDLTLAEAQGSPATFGLAAAFLVGALALFIWLARTLSAIPVLQAQRSTGQKLSIWRTLVPIGAGAALASLLAIVGVLVQGSESGARAISEARAKLGDDYRYHVSSLNVSSSGGETHVSGAVTAWKPGVVRNLPFSWRE